MNFDQWAARWNLPPQAIMELRHVYIQEVVNIPEKHRNDSEDAVASQVLRDGAYRGLILLRNNSGAFKNERDQWVRFGLGNVSTQFNKEYKSSDYIGIYPLYITPQYVGRTIGVFTAVETKKAAWKYAGTDEERAQGKFIDVVVANGGIGLFANNSGQLITALERFLQ